MELFKEMKKMGHELVMFGQDEATGMKAIIAVHSTVLGPALGGTRFWNYPSEEAALVDALKLSRAMTMKNAAAHLGFGGGKAVIMAESHALKSREFFHAYGRFVDSLKGKYFSAADVGITSEDLSLVKEVTPFVSSTVEISGSSSPTTAKGLHLAMKACCKEKYGSDSLAGKTVAMMGLGSVGYATAELLHKDGVKLKAFDLNAKAVEQAVKELGATAVPDQPGIIASECDIFAPCALGGVLNLDNIKTLKCAIVCGAANNPLVSPEVGDALDKMGILYGPDFIVNAGGVANSTTEAAMGEKYDIKVVEEKISRIYQTTLDVFKLAKEKGISTYRAADDYAWAQVEAGKKGK
ncbi:MAG: leucine dehydrogenase [Deltaproteobacteria bacterium]|nr:leucine dehydrogenase [Deltaproteobacteria bacterium]